MRNGYGSAFGHTVGTAEKEDITRRHGGPRRPRREEERWFGLRRSAFGADLEYWMPVSREMPQAENAANEEGEKPA
jgi:hypothetical protein